MLVTKLTAKFLQQEYRYHKHWKAFTKFYRQLYEVVSKYDTGQKPLLLQGPPNRKEGTYQESVQLLNISCPKKVREKSRECHNHKPQPFPDPKRKRKPTNLNKHKPNKRTKSTKISSLFPKRGNRNTKRTEKHKDKMTHGKTYKSPRRINHKATRSKSNTGTTALERSVEQTALERSVEQTKTPKGKKDALKAMSPQSKHYKQKAKRTVPFPKIGQTASTIKLKKITRTYIHRH